MPGSSMKQRDKKRIRHLLDAMGEANELLGDSSMEEVQNDRKLSLALEKATK
jgi:hypothetical protein